MTLTCSEKVICIIKSNNLIVAYIVSFLLEQKINLNLMKMYVKIKISEELQFF